MTSIFTITKQDIWIAKEIINNPNSGAPVNTSYHPIFNFHEVPKLTSGLMKLDMELRYIEDVWQWKYLGVIGTKSLPCPVPLIYQYHRDKANIDQLKAIIHKISPTNNMDESDLVLFSEYSYANKKEETYEAIKNHVDKIEGEVTLYRSLLHEFLMRSNCTWPETPSERIWAEEGLFEGEFLARVYKSLDLKRP